MKKVLFILVLFLFSCQKESETIIKEAKEEAEKIIQEAEKIKLTTENKLNQVFGNLSKYSNEVNKVNKKYIESFIVDSSKTKITFTFKNNNTEPIKPKFTIVFVNTYGFITDDLYVGWIFDTIKKGESRLDEKSINFKFEEPIYYYISYDLE